jgi:hypothetical protein
MRRVLYLAANLLGGALLALLILDPARPLLPVIAILGLGAGCLVMAGLVRRWREDR